MKTIRKPTALNERSFNVSLLHKALKALGLPVAKREVTQGKAGQDTLKKVRALQARLNVPVDKSTLADEATSLAITGALKERGLMAASRSFTVTGTVRLRTGEVRKRQRLLAFDLDLRGVAVYRTIKDIAEIKENGGFEFLGEAVSDNLGNYRIMFYDWQYRQAERKKADVVVYALDGEEIIGRSRMVNSEDYSEKGLVRDLDVIITKEDKRTEYKALMSALNAFLKESKTSLGEIATSNDQLAFTAGELDVDLSHINIAASAELLAKKEEKQLSHELLYGIGRQNIRLSWAALYKKQEEELRRAIAKSVDERIIRKFNEKEITGFLQAVRECAVKHVLDDKDPDNRNTLNVMLSNALPEEKQRISFMRTLGNFKGRDFRSFWNDHLPVQPEFKDNPELVQNLLLTQQFTLLTGNHQALVTELQVKRKFTSIQQLVDLEKSEWLNIIKKTGVPDFIEGQDDEEKMDRYAGLLQSKLNAAFPTKRIAKMVKKDELGIEKNMVSHSISTFLSKNEQFDFAGSRIHDFDEEIKTVAGDNYDTVRNELMKLQRVFQVSATPEAMPVLLENNLHSAYTIANIPRKSFLKTYSKLLGGKSTAFAIHQRASHISAQSEMTTMRMLEYSHCPVPAYATDMAEINKVKDILENQIPNYSELFGSPDTCECEHYRSIYSAAAYFVDLLRFLKAGVPNNDTKTPLDMLDNRRPDLLHLQLTCENTNTLIPYIDLANEVMEHYTAKDSLTNFKGHDTGEATAEELRANPQNFNLAAYRKLKDAKYPFTLPYHQPLDVIRTYSDHLKVSRYEAMKAMEPELDAAAMQAIESESLKISPEEYTILTGEGFDGTLDSTDLHKYFGYENAADFENMQDETDADGNPRGIRVLLGRTGLAYTDLVELVKTQFINPQQVVLDYIENIFQGLDINLDPSELYSKLQQIKAGTLLPESDTKIRQALDAKAIPHNEFRDNIIEDFEKLQAVITLYEPGSKCSLETTQLKTIESIYEGLDTSEIPWSKIHRFIRLWRKLSWTIHETDLMLAALGENDITIDTISKLESVSLLSEATKLPLNKMAVLWGNIGTYGDKSLYKKLFLNKAVQQIDEAFNAAAWGDYLQDETEILANHQSVILAAFRMTEEDLAAILQVAEMVVDDDNRPKLNIQNLSTIFRYVVLAKTLKLPVVDICKLIGLFSVPPFSTWDEEEEKFTEISPQDTYEFYQLAASTKEAGFKPSVLEYIFLKGTLPGDSTISLDKDKTLQTAKAIRDAFAIIEQNHPETPEAPLTAEAVTAKLSHTFQSEIVSRFMGIVEDSTSFEAITDDNLDVTIPDDLADKYTYIKDSGRLVCAGVMPDAEQSTLKSLANTNANFQTTVDELYAAPETFISENFNGVFRNLDEAKETLLDHPTQATAASLNEKLAYIYKHFLPVLKSKLRQDAITRYISALIGLSEEATALLIAEDIDTLITDLSTKGFSAAYFGDADWTTSILERVDSSIDFSWGGDAPADNFSVRWKAYVVAPASGEYTLVVDVEEADEAFKLYLDCALILEKTAAESTTSKEWVLPLNAAQLHLLTLEYAEASQNAGIRLRWKTATTALETIPASVAYPAAILDDFVAQATVFHRAAKFILGFEISETELNHFITFSADFGNINFEALEAGHWERIRDYMTLRNSVPQTQALLTEVFALANTPNPAPTVDDLRQLLYLATAWDEASLAFLVNTYFTLGVDDFKNEIALNRIYEVMQIVSKTGISAQTIAEWGAAETDFDTLHSTAQLIKNTVKAKYEEEDWLDLAGNLSDKIRENQKQALVSYLLMRPAIQNVGIEDADGLFEYFLIDVQMGACMDTSRIVQANAAIQMFVNRCLLNLESEMSSGSEKGVSPGAIDKDRWEWIKNYRMWEANRKVFLYPENWLEPEWRNDRSEFFKELESYLVQNDITERSVEQGLRNYLTSLNEVANLEVCGMYQEDYDDGELKYIHVFARTNNTPYNFFYRRWNEHKKWSAWEKVQVDIRSVEDGDNSGVHLLPVAWKKRLFLFWPEFIEKQEAIYNTRQSAEDAAGESLSDLEPNKYWEIKLAWSEYVEEKWSPKQISKEFIRLDRDISWYPNESVFRLISDIDSEDKLNIFIHFGTKALSMFLHVSPKLWFELGVFHFSDITSKIQSDYPHSFSELLKKNNWTEYAISFMNFSKYSALELLDDMYLQSIVDHKLLVSPNRKNYVPTLKDPFFFSDAEHTYFVRPVDIPHIDHIDAIKSPESICIIQIPLAEEPPPQPDDIFYLEHFFRRGSSMVNRSINRPVIFTSTGSGNANMAARRAMATRLDNAATTAVGTTWTSNLNSNGIKIEHVEMAFGASEDAGTVGSIEGIVGRAAGTLYWDILPSFDKGLEFHTFYHPFSSKYFTNLNQGGLSRGNKPPEEYPPGLMESDTEIPSDDGKLFDDIYGPTDKVSKPSNFESRTYYKENVCFDVYGANSLYNWELFFHAPLYIATRLSKNGKYEEAMKWFHYIFDPTTDEMPGAGESEISRYWKVLPFKTEQAKRMEDWYRQLNREPDPSSPDYDANSEYAENVSEWRDNPFDPHLVASNRPLAYMKHVVIKYVENLIAWGDSLFRQFTRESVNEALQIYVIANHILGPRPEFVPKRGEIKAESYYSLQNKWDDFSNALIELENIFPYSSEVSVDSTSTGTNLLGIGSALYFCIPANEKLLEYWDTVADRLFKIRHCQDLDGVERNLALFAPPISPEALIQAVSQGLSLGSILSDLSSPPPIYRFTYLIQKANEFCSDVKGLGSALLSALEKKDAEELSRLRASHETSMLELITAIRERQVLDAKAHKENLLKGRETASFRLTHYIDLLGNESVTVPAEPTIDAMLTADSQLPVDTSIPTIETDVDESLVDSDESGVKLIAREQSELNLSQQASEMLKANLVAELISGALGLIPHFTGDVKPIGVGAGTGFGGRELSWFAGAMAKMFSTSSQLNSLSADRSAKMASYIRREQDWTLQANLAAKEIIQLDKQITSADIRIQVAEKELENHKKQIENAKKVELFLKNKFTNQELYQWIKEQLFAVYKQSYNLAFDMAKKAEKAYKYELGTETANFIHYGYWDNSKQGLISGEKLQLALRQMEKSYLEENRRELELSKSISLALLNPLALIELKETGKCFVSLPEELFDLDYQGHYFRRIKLVSLSIPCIAGPYTTVNCSLRLLKNTTRVNTSMNSEGNYEHENDEGLWIDDDRFRSSNVPVTSIATSKGQNDAGMFEFNFRDERYLPFEGAGVISDWLIELGGANFEAGDGNEVLRQFDYATITDVILHLNYTARENGGLFKDNALTYIKQFIENFNGLDEQPFILMFSMRHEFPTEWHRFLHPTADGGEQVLNFTIGKERFPFFAQDRTIVVMKIDVFAKCAQEEEEEGVYHMVLSYTCFDEDIVTSPEELPDLFTMSPDENYGRLNKTTIGVNNAGLNLEELDITKEMTLKVKLGTSPDYTGLATKPDEVEDIYMVFHYKLGTES